MKATRTKLQIFFNDSVYCNHVIPTCLLVESASAIAVNRTLLLSVYNLTLVCVNLNQISSNKACLSFKRRTYASYQWNVTRSCFFVRQHNYKCNLDRKKLKIRVREPLEYLLRFLSKSASIRGT